MATEGENHRFDQTDGARNVSDVSQGSGRLRGGIVRTRNFLTHYSNNNSRVLTGTDLHWASVKLRTMFTVCLMLWLGLPEDIVRAMFNTNPEHSRERRQWLLADEEGGISKNEN